MGPLTKSDPSHAGWQYDLTIVHLRLGQALFELGRLPEASTNFDTALQIGKARDNSEIYFRRALTKLYLNDAAAASEDAATAVKLRPESPYFVLWLHVARLRARQNDADELAANARKVDQSKWPWPLIALFVGSITADEARNAALSTDQRTSVELSCVADFFVGIYRLERGAAAVARPLFQSAADHCPKAFVQYWAAKFELKRLDRSVN